jgi:hypothetical protein
MMPPLLNVYEAFAHKRNEMHMRRNSCTEYVRGQVLGLLKGVLEERAAASKESIPLIKK